MRVVPQRCGVFRGVGAQRASAKAFLALLALLSVVCLSLVLAYLPPVSLLSFLLARRGCGWCHIRDTQCSVAASAPQHEATSLLPHWPVNGVPLGFPSGGLSAHLCCGVIVACVTARPAVFSLPGGARYTAPRNTHPLGTRVDVSKRVCRIDVLMRVCRLCAASVDVRFSRVARVDVGFAGVHVGSWP